MLLRWFLASRAALSWPYSLSERQPNQKPTSQLPTSQELSSVLSSFGAGLLAPHARTRAATVGGVLRIEGILLHPTRCGPGVTRHHPADLTHNKKSETVDGFVATQSTRTGPGHQQFES
jgi:hypothetical protein